MAILEPEVLLVDRRGHHRLALEIADDAAGDDVGAGEGIVIAVTAGVTVLVDPFWGLLAGGCTEVIRKVLVRWLRSSAEI
jgi:hypothetical protein